MSTPPNIEVFNETVGKTLAFLYENFPRKIHFSVSELTGISEPGIPTPHRTEEEKAKQREQHQALELRYYSIVWLVDTGYISAKTTPFNDFQDAVLTAKGLEVLKIEPESLGAPYADKLLEASKDGASEILKNTASSLLTAGVGFAIKRLANLW